MFAQMRNSNRKRVILPPCPCGYTCRCHFPTKDINKKNKIILTITFCIPVLILISLISFLIYYGETHPYKGPEHIEVNGQMCEIQYHSDCVAPMSCGHKIAICEK